MIELSTNQKTNKTKVYEGTFIRTFEGTFVDTNERMYIEWNESKVRIYVIILKIINTFVCTYEARYV